MRGQAVLDGTRRRSVRGAARRGARDERVRSSRGSSRRIYATLRPARNARSSHTLEAHLKDLDHRLGDLRPDAVAREHGRLELAIRAGDRARGIARGGDGRRRREAPTGGLRRAWGSGRDAMERNSFIADKWGAVPTRAPLRPAGRCGAQLGGVERTARLELGATRRGWTTRLGERETPPLRREAHVHPACPATSAGVPCGASPRRHVRGGECPSVTVMRGSRRGAPAPPSVSAASPSRVATRQMSCWADSSRLISSRGRIRRPRAERS